MSQDNATRTNMASSSRSAPCTPNLKQTYIDGNERPPANNQKDKKLYAHQLVRTDAMEQKIDAFFSAKQDTCAITQNPTAQNTRVTFDDPQSGENNRKIEEVSEKHQETKILPPEQEILEVYSTPSSQEIRDLGLESINNLRSAVCEQTSPFLRSLIRCHTLVGCISADKAMIQHSTGLYLVNVQLLSCQLFYQVLLFRFGNFGEIVLSEPAPIKDLVQLCCGDDVDSTKLDQQIELLESNAKMLVDYFSIKIEDGRLHSIPQILTGYIPQMEGLPELAQSLIQTNWTDEQMCLEEICGNLAQFYSLKPEYCSNGKNTNLEPNVDWQWIIEHVLFPSFKAKLMPPKDFSHKNVISKLTDLSDLYKVFERC